MQTMHSILLVGPYDWQPDVIPETEFRQRIDAFWKAIPDQSVRGALVYGDSRRNAELVYLTGFTPKVRHALALVPRRGDPVVLAPGSKAGLTSAKRLTWAKNVDLLADSGKALAAWKEQLGADSRIALVGGALMRGSMHQALAAHGELIDATSLLQQLMLQKRPSEVDALRRSSDILNVARRALNEAHAGGANATAAVIKAERAAYRAGAQDVQILFSLDGGRTLRPYEGQLEQRAETLQTHIAVRCAGYWAVGFISASGRPQPAFEAAKRSLAQMVEHARAGVPIADLQRAADSVAAPFKPHPLIADAAVSSIGLAIEEQDFASDPKAALRAGGVYCLQAGAKDSDQHGLASAIVLVGAAGPEVLWRS